MSANIIDGPRLAIGSLPAAQLAVQMPETVTLNLRANVERKQSKVDSWIETIVNIAIGYAISWSAWKWVIGPLTGVHTNDRTNTAIVSLFTVTSIARQYVIRRTFNGRPIWATIKGRFS